MVCTIVLYFIKILISNNNNNNDDDDDDGDEYDENKRSYSI